MDVVSFLNDFLEARTERLYKHKMPDSHGESHSVVFHVLMSCLAMY